MQKLLGSGAEQMGLMLISNQGTKPHSGDFAASQAVEVILDDRASGVTSASISRLTFFKLLLNWRDSSSATRFRLSLRRFHAITYATSATYPARQPAL